MSKGRPGSYGSGQGSVPEGIEELVETDNGEPDEEWVDFATVVTLLEGVEACQVLAEAEEELEGLQGRMRRCTDVFVALLVLGSEVLLDELELLVVRVCDLLDFLRNIF